MNPSDSPNTTETTLTQDLVYAVRYYLGGRRGLILLTVAVLGIGVALNWGWLVAVGVAPLLVAVAPCAVMCGLGLCMHKGMGKSCSTDSGPADQSHLQAKSEEAITDGTQAVKDNSAKMTAVNNGSKRSKTMDERRH